MGIDMQFSITIVYSAQPRDVTEMTLLVEPGCTVAQAMQLSGLFAELSHGVFPVAGQGVWGRKVPPSHVLRDQDRLEVYRPLTVDPKVARRERFVSQGAKKAAGLFAKRRAGAKAGY